MTTPKPAEQRTPKVGAGGVGARGHRFDWMNARPRYGRWIVRCERCGIARTCTAEQVVLAVAIG